MCVNTIFSLIFVKILFLMAETIKQQKHKQILLDLFSNDSKKVSKAIKALEVNGTSESIKPLADKLLTNPDAKIKSAIIELLSSLKDSSVCVEIIDVINDDKYITVRQEILSSIWNTKVDFSNYIDEFVEIAITGSFMETLDCLTIIENLEGPFMEENILECQLHLKNYMESNAPKDEQKSQLLSEIAIAIKDINENLID